MEIGQATLTFGNIVLTNGWEYTLQDGVEPQAFLLRSPPHLPSLELFSDVNIYQDGLRRTFRDCHICDPVFEAGMDGQEWTLPILDRRWKWRGRLVSGSYNVRQADETLLREKTPQEIASLCLIAMGEVGYDVSALPNAARPHVTWNDAEAREELDRLCHDLGCIVCIDADGTNVTYLARIGDGPSLPPGPALGGEYSLAAKPLPSEIQVITDRTVYEADFVLQQVGMDTDMSFKLPNALSITPPTGWESQWPDSMFGVTGTYVDPFDGQTKQRRDLAIGYIYRAYRIIGIGVAGNWQPWGTGPDPNHWSDIQLVPEKLKDLELLSSRASEIVIGDGVDAVKEPLPAFVRGTWFEWFKGEQTDKIWPWGFSLDTNRGIVTMSQPAFLYDPTTPATPFFFADLKLRTAFYAGKDGVFNRYGFREDVPGSLPGAPPQQFYRRELRRRLILGSFATIDNVTDLNLELITYASDALDTVYPTDATSVTYEEIRDDIDLSGKVRQITYSGGGGKTGTTRVSTGTPHNPYLETSDTQRLPREIREALRPLRRLGVIDYTLPSKNWWQS